jgi:hypothetical protein
MRRSLLFWTAAAAITLTSAAWQRRTGPTYPVSGEVTLGGQPVALLLARSHGGEGDQPVRIRVEDGTVAAELRWRRFPTSEPWTVVPMRREGQWLAAVLPHQPPAGKLEYQVRLTRGDQHVLFPSPAAAVTRFKGHVPVGLLAPHIALMFLGMLFSTRTGLEALAPDGRSRLLARISLAFIAVGGLVLGPLVQKAAFGALWTGVPFGYDLTDNKTLISALAWGWAVWRARGDRTPRLSVLAAAVITLVVFAIPHSTWGSQINWE